jgi:hypothetical protein
MLKAFNSFLYTKLKLKHITPSHAYGAMVSWTNLVEKTKTLDSTGLYHMDHPTGLYPIKNIDSNGLTDLTLYSSFTC